MCNPILAECKTPLGKFFRSQRLKLGLTQGEVAEKLGVSRNYISLIETGAATLCDSNKMLLKIAKIFGLSINDFKKLQPARKIKGRKTGLGVIITTCRQKQGLSQSELAKLSGLKPETINAIENGRIKNPTPATANKIGNILRNEINIMAKNLNAIWILSLLQKLKNK